MTKKFILYYILAFFISFFLFLFLFFPHKEVEDLLFLLVEKRAKVFIDSEGSSLSILSGSYYADKINLIAPEKGIKITMKELDISFPVFKYLVSRSGELFVSAYRFFLSAESGIRLSGRLQFSSFLEGIYPDEIEFSLSNGKLNNISYMGFKIEELKYTKITFVLDRENNSYKIKKGRLNFKDFNGSLTGRINFISAYPYLDIKINLFIKNREFFSSTLGIPGDMMKDSLKVSIRGSISNPKVELLKGF